MDLGNGLGHLTYSTLVHPGDTWSEMWDSLNRYVPQVKARVSPNKTFGVSLRLSAASAKTLTGDPQERDRLRARGTPRAATILGDDGLADLIGELGREQPRRDVGERTGRERHHDADRAVRPAGLGEAGVRDEERQPGEQQRAAVNHRPSDLILDRFA